MNEKKLELVNELARKAGANIPYGSDSTGLADFDYHQFADLIIKDMLRVVAAHALSNDSALDVFTNLKRLYE